MPRGSLLTATILLDLGPAFYGVFGELYMDWVWSLRIWENLLEALDSTLGSFPHRRYPGNL